MMKKSILVVGTIPALSEPIILALTGAGYEIQCVDHTDDALRRMESRTLPFDLLLVDSLLLEDVILPFSTRVEEYVRIKDAALIMLTDMSDKDAAVHALKSGIHDYILKCSFSFPELLAKIERYAVRRAHLQASTNRVREVCSNR